jgi:3-oxoacyl-[acyl-carrier-protein] synthase-3
LFVPHQANLRIIEAIGRRLGIDGDRVAINIEEYGNTSSASIPLALDEAVRSGRLTEGMNVLTCGLGAGLTWGAALMRW